MFIKCLQYVASVTARARCLNHPRTCHLTKLAKLISRIYIAVLLSVIAISKTSPHALMESWAIT